MTLAFLRLAQARPGEEGDEVREQVSPLYSALARGEVV
jgi:hypothetical protein